MVAPQTTFLDLTLCLLRDYLPLCGRDCRLRTRADRYNVLGGHQYFLVQWLSPGFV